MILKQSDKMAMGDPDLKAMIDKMIMDMPLRLISMMSDSGGGGMSLTQVEGLVEMLNGHYLKGLRQFRKNGGI